VCILLVVLQGFQRNGVEMLAHAGPVGW
jgi:hypothetical protein